MLMAEAVDAGNRVSILRDDAPDLLVEAFRDAAEREEFCGVLAVKYFDELTAAVERDRREWWRCSMPPAGDHIEGRPPIRRCRPLPRVLPIEWWLAHLVQEGPAQPV